MTDTRIRLVYLVTEDWYFWSHRADLARAAGDAGYEVIVATRVSNHSEQIRKEGFQLESLGVVRRRRNPFQEFGTILELVRLYRRVKPDIVHHVAMKPILYGSLAARFAGVPAVINAFAGLGYTFTEERSGLLHWGIKMALKAAVCLGTSTVLVQNCDDQERLIQEGIVPASRIKIIAGSGVDVNMFSVQPSPSGESIVLLPARMLWDKGIGEFVEAARCLKHKGARARFILVGKRDEHNPAAIPEACLMQWVKEEVVEWWGHREDMPAVYQAATLVVLPSYREGLPKSLLEAASCGRAIVATDVPGCREVVRDQFNGLLVPPKDSAALAKAIEELLSNHSVRETMGHRSRELVLSTWSVPRITEQVLKLYHDVLKTSPAADRLHEHV